MIKALSVTLLSLVVSSHASARTYSYADAHQHYVDFLQQSQGIEALVQAMDEAGVSSSMLSGLSVVKKWDANEPKRPIYYMGDDAALYWYSLTDVMVARAIQSLPPLQQRRFHPFITGFNATDLNAIDHIRRMLEWYPGFWQGIGEVFTRHDDLTALTYGEPGRANHQAMDAIYALAAEYDLPVLVHANITSTRMPEPLYLAEFEQALAMHPRTKIIWAHAGTSGAINRRQVLPFLENELERLLGRYPNLYVDLSWSVLRPYILDQQGRPSPRWLQLIKSYPDRFMLGSDLVGTFTPLKATLEEFSPLLDALPLQVAQRLAKDNFLALLPKR